MDSGLPQKDLQTRIFEWFARRSQAITRLFGLLYLFIFVLLAVAAYFVLTKSPFFDIIYQIGKKFGQTALVLLGVVVLPGILGRFRVEIKLTRIITLFRRQLGITVFLLATAHSSLMRGLPLIAGLVPFRLPLLFELAGYITMLIFFLMFLTSNNLSIKIMGPWWKRIHRFVYLAVWLLVFHTGLQRISIWSVGIFAVGALEVISWVYDFFKRKQFIQN